MVHGDDYDAERDRLQLEARAVVLFFRALAVWVALAGTAAVLIWE